MGKIRATIIGSEDEQKQKQEAKKRREAKKLAKESSQNSENSENSEHSVSQKVRNSDNQTFGQSNNSDSPSVPKKEKPATVPLSGTTARQRKKSAKKVHSPRWVENVKLREKNKQYSAVDALALILSMKQAKFDESLELHINTTEKGISGNITLPHGTGKKTKVAIFAPALDLAAADKLLTDINAGKIDFDILVATPDAMPKLAKVARILGPRGLMPNPKNGTITPRPEEVAKKFAAGQVHFKTEAKANILHLAVGKTSFGKEKLKENITAFMGAIDKTKIKSAYIKSTMSPSVRINL